MILILLALINATILAFLAGLHFYWTFGGSWGFSAVLPTNTEGQNLLIPKPYHSLIVALSLLSFSLFHLVRVQLLDVKLPNWLSEYGLLIIGSLFFLRAIGDFKYVGIFKKVRNTVFGINDTRYFYPLCIVIGVLAFIIEFLN